MAKTDNTRQIIYDLKGVLLDVNDDGDIVLSNDDIGQIKLNDILEDFMGFEIDLKIGGAEKIGAYLFAREDDTDSEA